MAGPWKCHRCNDGSAILREVCPRCDHLKCALCRHLELVHQSRLDDDGMLRGLSIFGNGKNTTQSPGDMEIDEIAPRDVIESLRDNQVFRRFDLDQVAPQYGIPAGFPIGSSGGFENNPSAYGSQPLVEKPKENNQAQGLIAQPVESSSGYHSPAHISGGTTGQGQYTSAAELPQQQVGVSQPRGVGMFTLPIRLARGVEPSGGGLGNEKKGG